MRGSGDGTGARRGHGRRLQHGARAGTAPLSPGGRRRRRVRLASPDRHQHPVAGEAAAAMSPQERKGDHLAAPHPRHEQQPRDHRIDPAALQGDVVDRGRQRSAGKPAQAPRRFPSPAGRALLAGETGPEARRSHRRRRARRASPLLVELGEVAGERRVLEAPAGEPSVEALALAISCAPGLGWGAPLVARGVKAPCSDAPRARG